VCGWVWAAGWEGGQRGKVCRQVSGVCRVIGRGVQALRVTIATPAPLAAMEGAPDYMLPLLVLAL
jgi:hypothetical protein